MNLVATLTSLLVAGPIAGSIAGSIAGATPTAVQGPAVSVSKRQGQAGERLAQRVAAWRADELTRDDGPKALETLRSLVSQGEAELRDRPTDEGAQALLTELYRLELDGLAKRGQRRELTDRVVGLLELAHAAKPSPIRKAARIAIDAERIRAVLGPLSSSIPSAQQGAASKSSASQEILAAAVEEALVTGETEFLAQIGTAAAPSLAEIARRPNGSGKGKIEQSALVFLCQIQPASALDVAQELASQGDVILKSRVVAAFKEAKPFQSPEVWRATGRPGRYEPRKLQWAEIVPKLIEAPGVPAAMTHAMIVPFIQRDFVPEGYSALIEDTLGTEGWDGPVLRDENGVLPNSAREAAARVIGRWTQDGPVTPQLIGALRTYLRGQDAALVYSLAGTTDPALRRLVCEAFGPREIHALAEPGRGEREEVLPIINEEYRSGLDRFMRSRSDLWSGRALELAAAVEVLTPEEPAGRTQPVVPAALIAAWLKSAPAFAKPNEELAWFRSLVVHFEWLAAGERRQLMPDAAAWIAEQTDDQALQRQLVEVLFGSSDSAQSIVDAADALMAAGLVSEAGSGLAIAAKKHLAHSPEDAARPIEWMIKNGALEHWQQFIERKREPGGSITHEPFIKGLSDEDRKALARSLWMAGYDKLNWLGQADLPLSRTDCLELLRDEGLTADGAKWLFAELIDTKGEPVPLSAAKLFARVIAKTGDSPVPSRRLAEIGLPPEALLFELLERSDVPDQMLLDFYVPLQSRNMIERVYARFPKETWKNHKNSPLISSLVTGIARERSANYVPELIEALEAGSMVQASLAGILEYESSRVFLPLAEAMLWQRVPVELASRKLALGYIASFLDSESVEILISAARRTRDPRFRAEIFAEVERIIAWQEAESKWRAGQGSAQKRDVAITELTHILDDANSSESAQQRALRGLGLLGAVEEIPRLIRTMETGPAPLQKAAQEALDSLQSEPDK